MDTTTHHPLSNLFAQLGLPDSAAEIRAFIVRHRPLAENLRLADAPIWTEAQANFLKEHLRADDGDWALRIDELDTLLREHPPVDELPRAEEDGDVPANEGEGNVTAARRYNEATREHVDRRDVSRLARAAAPADAAEAATLREAERKGRQRARH